jgi:hypothetical protein
MFGEIVRRQPQQSVTSGQMIGGVVANQYDGRRRFGSFDCAAASGTRVDDASSMKTSQPSALALFFVRNATDRS